MSGFLAPDFIPSTDFELTQKDVFTTVKYMIIMMIPRTIELLIIVNCWTYALGRKKKIIVFATEDKLSLI